MEFKCLVCKKSFKRWGSSIPHARTCSRACAAIYRKADKETDCTQCGKKFHIKKSQKLRYTRTHGFFCSRDCVAKYRKESGVYLGDNNPHSKNRRVSSDGYPLISTTTFGKLKEHKQVVLDYLNIPSIPKGMQIHHRDCDKTNNKPENLVVLSASDHRWLHKNFGNAPLWALCHNQVALEVLISWVKKDNKEKAEKLLTLSLADQKLTEVFKLGELGETPEEDNTEPSINLNG
jgi:hypothetical protein